MNSIKITSNGEVIEWGEGEIAFIESSPATEAARERASAAKRNLFERVFRRQPKPLTLGRRGGPVHLSLEPQVMRAAAKKGV